MENWSVCSIVALGFVHVAACSREELPPNRLGLTSQMRAREGDGKKDLSNAMTASPWAGK